jgi:hypothetical protein
MLVLEEEQRRLKEEMQRTASKATADAIAAAPGTVQQVGSASSATGAPMSDEVARLSRLVEWLRDEAASANARAEDLSIDMAAKVSGFQHALAEGEQVRLCYERCEECVCETARVSEILSLRWVGRGSRWTVSRWVFGC